MTQTKTKPRLKSKKIIILLLLLGGILTLLWYNQPMFNLFSKKAESPIQNQSDFPQFVGFFTAHTVWQIEGGENVVPLIAIQKGKERKIERIANSSYEKAVTSGRQRVKEIQNNNDYILFAYDGFLTLKGEKYEAIFVEAFKPKEEQVSTIHFAIPYRNAKSKEGLAIYRPKVTTTNIPDSNEFFAEFYKGVKVHTKASEFWNKYLDQSQ